MAWYPEHLEVGKLKTFNNGVRLKHTSLHLKRISKHHSFSLARRSFGWALPKMLLFILKDIQNLELGHESVQASGCWVRADAIPSAEWKQRIRKYPLGITRMPKSWVSALSYITFQLCIRDYMPIKSVLAREQRERKKNLSKVLSSGHRLTLSTWANCILRPCSKKHNDFFPLPIYE